MSPAWRNYGVFMWIQSCLTWISGWILLPAVSLIIVLFSSTCCPSWDDLVKLIATLIKYNFVVFCVNFCLLFYWYDAWHLYKWLCYCTKWWIYRTPHFYHVSPCTSMQSTILFSQFSLSIWFSTCPSAHDVVLYLNKCIYRKKNFSHLVGHHPIIFSPNAITKFQGNPLVWALHTWGGENLWISTEIASYLRNGMI